MTFRVRFWGTRGSIPTPGRQTVRYGGNTPCIELRTAEDWLVILDAGTGLRELGRDLMERTNGAPIRGDIFVTHAHWDHIQGIPFFAPMFHHGNHFTLWGSRSLHKSLARVVRDQMSPVVFPVRFDDLSATIDFREMSEERCEGRGYAVHGLEVRHPGGALGYRFDAPGSDRPEVVYISDNELGDGAVYDTRADWRERCLAFVRGARLLVHDTTYTAEEYARHRGWGHSSYDDAVALAIEAGVERLVLFHHKPERADDEIDRRADECRELVAKRGATLEIIAAAEGMTIDV
jgi:phosphoribosyl 1,2-cyclic phosphodiesterase